jgi:hypothetical protein
MSIRESIAQDPSRKDCIAAVGYAAVENAEAGRVEAVVPMLQRDPEAVPTSIV